MKLLDLSGLTHFWSKVKTFVSNEYLSLTGGIIRGSVSFLDDADGGKSIRIDPSNITNSRYEDNYLFASGKMIPIGEANGVAGLDSNGNVPLAQLGNLDTTVAEVVTALPTTNIKKHIYLIKDTDVAQNQYEEYIYTGDTSATYDASKWEKLGDFRATVDLADYAKKSEAAQSVNANYATTSIFIKFIAVDGHDLSSLELFGASSNRAGLMIASDKNKLDGIADNANNYSLPTASSTIKGGITLGYSQSGKNYPVALDGNGKAYVNVPWTDTNTTYGLATSTNDGLMKASDKAKIDSIDTTYAKKNKAVSSLKFSSEENQVKFSLLNIDEEEINHIYLGQASKLRAGVMTASDKSKLDSISSGATADSAITTAEIDALFA